MSKRGDSKVKRADSIGIGDLAASLPESARRASKPWESAVSKANSKFDSESCP